MFKDKIWVKRARRTFFQTFIGIIATDIGVVIAGASDKTALVIGVSGLIASGVAAGIAAVQNMKEE